MAVLGPLESERERGEEREEEDVISALLVSALSEIKGRRPLHLLTHTELTPRPAGGGEDGRGRAGKTRTIGCKEEAIFCSPLGWTISEEDKVSRWANMYILDPMVLFLDRENGQGGGDHCNTWMLTKRLDQL